MIRGERNFGAAIQQKDKDIEVLPGGRVSRLDIRPGFIYVYDSPSGELLYNSRNHVALSPLMEGKKIRLSGIEGLFLETLLLNDSQLVSIEQFMECFYDYMNADGHKVKDTNIINVYILRLRKKLGDYNSKKRCSYSHSLIHTFRGLGYSLATDPIRAHQS